MNEAEKLDLLARAQEQMRALDDTPIKCEMSLTQAISLIGQLQLALRNPANTGASRDFAEGFVKALIDRIDPTRGDVWKFLRLGFNPKFDEVRDE